MNQKFLLFPFLFFSTILFAQKEKKLSIEINYGLNGNFFVKSYNETVSPPAKFFYKKKFIGTIGGLEMQYSLNKKSRIGLAFAQSKNSKAIDYSGSVFPITIINFHITHLNRFFQFFYDRNFSKKIPGFALQAGFFYLRMNQQEIEIADRINGGALLEERNYKTYKLEEGGAFFGVHYSKKIDTKFDLGIKSRVYYLISTSSFEAITLTPTLIYHF